MRKSHILSFLLIALLNLLSYGQITIIGHTKLNNAALTNTDIFVKDGNAIVKTLNTKNKSEFMLNLDFGKVYQIYFQHANCPVMFMEVIANTIPQDKYDYRMGYEMNVPFVNSQDNDVDTTVFKEPFHKIVYNGKTKMTDDTLYNNGFSRNILKKPERVIKSDVKSEKSIVTAKEQRVIIAGIVTMDENSKSNLSEKTISLLGKEGNIIKTTNTNRRGAFVFTDILASEIFKITLTAKETETLGKPITLSTDKRLTVANSSVGKEENEWILNTEQIAKLIDNHYSTNIGGKLVSSSLKEKKFFAGKTVYLSNRFNTILKKTKTNLFGTFVFEDIKPDNDYYIGVDNSDITSGEKLDLLTKDDSYIATLDTLVAERISVKINTSANKIFNDLSIGDDDMKMDIKATIFGDNVNTPIGKLKIILLNDEYQVIDSVLTDDFGTFKFKYLPFLKRFYLSAENTDNMLDVFKNILIYSSDDNLIKVMTHQKGTKFSYKPVNAEMSILRDIELDDPWLEFVGDKKSKPSTPFDSRLILGKAEPKSIIENILFENNKYEITPKSKKILDKIVLVLNTNKNLKIEIGAHTDSKGMDATNLKLSQMRAKTVRDYITSAGIDAKRIISKGYGESQPRANCVENCTEEQHAQNRRIEFKILGE